MPAIHVKSYAHVNKAFSNWDSPEGKIIRSKDHYDRTMKEQGMVSYEQMQQQASQKKLKEYSLSAEGKAIIQSAKASKDKNGKVRLSDRTIEALIKKGAIGNVAQPYMNVSSIKSDEATGWSLSPEQQAIVDGCKQ